MNVRFICGCETKEIISRDNLPTLSMVVEDEEGFLICKIHRERRVGWRSVPYMATRMAMPGMGAWTPLEYEAFLLYGEVPMMTDRIDFKPSVKDRRDNRDPVAIGVEIIKRREIRRAEVSLRIDTVL